MNIDPYVNDFAFRSFREIADGDYIAARLAYRARLIPQFLWSSLQAIEKYLKCILVINRIRARGGHDLNAVLKVFEDSKKFDIRLSAETRKFIDYLDTYGRHRYCESSYHSLGKELFSLDRAVWEIRRYARILDYKIKTNDGNEIQLLPHELRRNVQAEAQPPQDFSSTGGLLDAILTKGDHPSRKALIWQNAYFGKSRRNVVCHPNWSIAVNSPLALHPEILDEVLKYVFLPKDVIAAYRKEIANRPDRSK